MIMATSWGLRFGGLALQQIAAALWMHAWQRAGARPGWQRLAVVVPLLPLFIAAPRLWFQHVLPETPDFAEGISVCITGFLVMWLASFKSLAWALNRGPLLQREWSPLQFAALLALPILPAAGSTGTSTATSAQQKAAARVNGTVAAVAGVPEGQKARRRSARLAALQQQTEEEVNGSGGEEQRTNGHLHDGPNKHGNTSNSSRLRGGAGGGSLQLLLQWVLKVALVGVLVQLLSCDLSPFTYSLVCTGVIYSFLGVVMDGPASVVMSWLGLRLAPHMKAPWEAESIAAFWGLHWNQAASNALRTLIYEPICEGRLVKAEGQPTAAAAGTAAGEAPIRQQRAGQAPAPGSRHGHSRQQRRLAGMAACFIASGLLHELIIFDTSGSPTPGWKWMLFFSCQPLLILGQTALQAWLLRTLGLRLPCLARRALTLLVLIVLGHFLFFQPVVEANLPQRFTITMQRTIREIGRALSLLPA